VKLAPYKSNKFQEALLQHYALFNFAKRYALAHKITQSFEVDDALLLDFRKFSRLGEDYLQPRASSSRTTIAALQPQERTFRRCLWPEEGLKYGRKRSGCDQSSGPDAAGARAGRQRQESGAERNKAPMAR